MDVLELFASLKMDISEYLKSLSDAEGKANSFGSKLSSGLGKAAKVGAAAVAAVGTVSVAVGKKMVDGAKELAAYGDNVDKMSQKIGISAEAYQEWDAVFQHSGASVNSLQQGMKTLNNQLMKVTDEASHAKSPFAQLGISLEEVQAAAKDPDHALELIISHLQELPAGAERSALATQLLGRSGVELGALLNTSAEDTQKMRDRVHELGGVLSDEGVKAAAKFTDNMQDLKTAISGVKRSIQAETLPAFNSFLEGFTSLIAGEEGAEEAIQKGTQQMSEAIEKIIPKIGTLLENLLPAVVSVGGKIVASLAEQIPKVVVSIARQIPGLIKELIKAIGKMFPELIKAGVEILNMIAEGLKNIDGIIDMILDLMDTIFNTIIDNLPLIIDAALLIIERLADGLVNNIDKIVDAVLQIIQKLLTTLIEHLPEILQKGKDILLSLVRGITENIPKIVESIIEVIKNLIQTIIENLPEILQAGIEIILELAKGLLEAIPQLIVEIPKIITSIIEALLSPEMIGKLLGAGFDIISNIFDGLFNGDFAGTMGDVIEGLLGAILAIPGAIMEIGAKIVGFILDGIKSAWNSVVDWVEGQMENLFGNPLEKYQDGVYVEPRAAGYDQEALEAKRSAYNKNKAAADIAKSMEARYNPNYSTNVYIGYDKAGNLVRNSNRQNAGSNGGH